MFCAPISTSFWMAIPVTPHETPFLWPFNGDPSRFCGGGINYPGTLSGARGNHGRACTARRTGAVLGSAGFTGVGGGDRLSLNHLSLFSGIGGLDLAAEWAGFTTVGQCEFADYQTKVLEKHWPDVPRWRDIRTLTKESFYERTGRRTVDIISGGFPCQPFSVAGKQKGKEDDRYLWPEMLRVIRELTPHWVIGENVPGILHIAGRTVCEDLEREGYAVTVFNFEAAAVGAPHRRDRVFFVANTGSCGFGRERDFCNIRQLQGREIGQGKADIIEQSNKISADVADSNNPGLQGRECEELPECSGERAAWQGNTYVANAKSIGRRACGAEPERQPREPRTCWGDWWAVEPDVGRVANGVSHRVDRLKCLGNAVVPQQAYPIFRAIAELEVTP